MTPATATTTAKAVRQHGGGLVHATQPRAALRSRLQCPSGGVKKSLCCVAAGINALDLQATAARAYPMTGVRRAQKLSTTLRSPIRPPAQLVVGYRQSAFDTNLKEPEGRILQQLAVAFNRMDSGLIRPFVRNVPSKTTYISKPCEQMQVSSSYFWSLETSAIERISLIVKRTESLIGVGPVASLGHKIPGHTEGLGGLQNARGDLPRHCQAYRVRIISLFLGTPISSAGYPNRCEYRKNRADSLHPGRPVDVLRKNVKLLKRHIHSHFVLSAGSVPAGALHVHGRAA